MWNSEPIYICRKETFWNGTRFTVSPYKICPVCNELLSLDDFIKWGSEGWKLICYECRRKRELAANKKLRRIRNMKGQKLRYAVKTGKIIKPSNCSVCGKTDCRIEGHHNDYRKILEVEWVCTACHRNIHAKIGNGVEIPG